MDAGTEKVVAVQSCSVLVPANHAWMERTSLYHTDLILSPSDLTFTFDSPDAWLERRIGLEDLIGIRVHGSESASHSDETFCAVDIHSLPLVSTTGWFTGNSQTQTRKHKVDRVLFGSEDTFRHNMKRALAWKRIVMQYCERAVKTAFVHADTAASSSNDKNPEKHQRLLVLINPVSGKGKSLTLFKSQVQPLFELADIDLEIYVTDEPGHARNLVQTCNISEIDGIVIVSGDGLINEVVTGLMKRRDWEKAIKTPIGQIPTGSGNVLCSSLFYQNKEDMSLASAALQIIRGGIEAVDLATVHTTDKDTTYMLLLANWGTLADIDIESESLRCFGGLIRDYLGALKCIIQGRTYPGRLHYLPVDSAGSLTEALKQEQSAPTKKLGSGANGVDLSFQRFPTVLPSTPNSTLPETWKTIDGVFTLVCPLMAPTITADFIGHPDVQLGSGEITILYILDDATRWDLVSIMLEGGSGNWVNHPKVHIVKAKAFRIEPLCDSGIITVDGEVVAYGPTQAQVHRHAVRVFSRKHIINA